MADETLPPCRQDGPVLHFLKELPGWSVCFVALIFFTIVFIFTRDDFIPRIIDALLGGFLGSVVNQVRKSGTQITTDTVQTDAVNTDQMDVNAKNLNVNKEK